jgi:hypothetical protein
MKITVFLVAAPCILVEVYRRFRDAYCLHHQGDEYMIEAASTSETSVNFYQTTRRNNPEYSRLVVNLFFCEMVSRVTNNHRS